MFWRSRLLVKSAQWIAMTTWAAALKSQNLYTATTIKNGHHHLRAALVKLWASSSKETRVGTPWKNASSLLLLASFLSSSSEICWIEASIIWQFWADLSNPQLAGWLKTSIVRLLMCKNLGRSSCCRCNARSLCQQKSGYALSESLIRNLATS